MKQIREEDTDWRKWLLDKPYRPFDPRAYFEFRLYKDFSSGIADQWMTHGIDMVHYLLDDHFPKSVMAQGGVYVWHDGRENPDTFQALLEYPKGFLVSYSTSFGNDCDSSTRIMGKKATLINIGGEGSRGGSWWKKRASTRAIRSSIAPAKFITLGKEKLQELPMSERLFTGAVEKTYGPLPFISDAQSFPHEELVRLPAQPQAAECHGGEWLRAFGGRDHGRAVATRREKTVLGCGQRADCGSAAGVIN